MKRPLQQQQSKDDLDIPSQSTSRAHVVTHASSSAPSASRHYVIPREQLESTSKWTLPQLGSKGKEKAVDQADEPTESFLHRLAGPSTGKAGLKRDPAEVRRIIYDASKGSAFFKNEQQKDAETEKQVNHMLERLKADIARRHDNLSAEEREIDQRLDVLESTMGRHLDQVVVVVDADAFYASVEELDDPSLKGKAFGVGSGVLTTASYEARKYGVRSAMAGFVAKKLCPHLIFVPTHFDRYNELSSKIMAILARYDPSMAPASLDEAYLNITAFCKTHGRTPEDVVSELRASVKAETGLTVSAGCGPNKMIAKIAADVNKPDGQCIVAPTRQAVLDFLHPMPVRKVPGIGRVMERWLDALQVSTVADIYAHRGKLALVGKEIGLEFLLKAYLGLGSAVVEPGKREDRKSIGNEKTFSTIYKEEDLFRKLEELAVASAEDLKRLQFSGRTITLKLKLDTYQILNRAHTAGSNVYYSTKEDIHQVGKMLLNKELQARYKAYDSGAKVTGSNGARELRLRLMGLRITNLRDESEQAKAKRGGGGGSLLDWTTHSPPKKRPKTMSDAPTVNNSKTETKEKKKTSSLVSSTDAVLENTTCPSCATCFLETTLAQFNRHLDTCLLNSSSQPIPVSPPAARKANSKKQDHSAFSVMMTSSKSLKPR